MKTKVKTELERKIFKIIINSYPKRTPDGQLREIMKLIKEYKKADYKDGWGI